MPVIRVSEETYRRLRELKQRLGHESFNATIAYLLDFASDPRNFIMGFAFFMSDIRNDVKKIAENLEKLSKFLH